LLLLLLDPCLSQQDEGAHSFLPFRDESRLNDCSAMTMELSDAQLVGRCRNGDAAAWNELVERFSRYVYAIAVRAYRLAEHDAEDVFQDVFARAYERLVSLRDDAAIRPWLAQLTRNACVDKLRSTAREQPAEEPSAEEADAMLERLDESLDIHDALETLSADCREILDRFFARDESYRTIGEALDLPAGTIASRISRCLGKLRENLEGRKPDPDPSGGL
jgi:RNA polymerase sigma factor (sigma-70 family)